MTDNCTNKQTKTGLETYASLVTWDGGSLCIGISAGSMVDVIDALSTAVCDLQSTISGLTFNTNDITLTGITTPNCLSVTNSDTLTQALQKIITGICTNTSDIANLDASQVAYSGGKVYACHTYTGTTVEQMIEQLATVICNMQSSGVQQGDMFSGGIYAIPVNNFVKTTLIATDVSSGGYVDVSSGGYVAVSSGGTPIVDIGANDYYVDGTNVHKAAENITLLSNTDNYVYLDNTTAFAWAVSSVAIGGTPPTTTGVQVLLVRTGTGTITTITQLIAGYPIDNSQIADNAIDIRNIDSSVAGAGLSKSTALNVNVDGSTIDITGGNALEVKDGGIVNTKINSNVAGYGLKQNVDKSLSPNTDDTSITLDGSYKITDMLWKPGVGTYALVRKQAGSTSTGIYGFSTGNNSLASGSSSVALGNSSIANGDYSTALGIQAVSYLTSSIALGLSYTINGGKQTLNGVLGLKTIDATPDILIPQISIPTDCFMKVEVELMAVQTGGSAGTLGDGFWQAFTFVITNLAGTLTTVFSASGTAEHSAGFGGSAALSLDGTNYILKIQATGEADKTIEWFASYSMGLIGFRNFNIT